MNQSIVEKCIYANQYVTHAIYVHYVVYGVSLVLGCLGNCLVIATALWRKNRTPFHLATTHLAFCDFIVGLRLVTRMRDIVNKNVWKGTAETCKFAFILPSIAFFSSVQTMVFIALERRNKVVCPLSKPWTFTKVFIIIILIWTLSISTYLPYLKWLHVGKCGICGLMSSKAQTLSFQIYATFVFVLKYVIPLVTIIFCYHSVIITLFRRPKANKHRVSGVSRENKETKRIVTTLIATVIAFTIMTLPSPLYYIILTFSEIGQSSQSLKIISDLSSMYYLHACINPIIYVCFNKTFRSDAIRTLKVVFCNCFVITGTDRRANTRNRNMIKPSPRTCTLPNLKLIAVFPGENLNN